MKNKRQKTAEYYLLDTHVENMFINEYMATAPGDYVKVYIYALMYADLCEDMPNDEIAKQLGLEEEDVLKAWTYWEGMGVIKKNRQDSKNHFDYSVEFTDLKNKLYGKPIPDEQPSIDEETKAVLSDQKIREMYTSIEKITGQTVGGTEMMEVISWINDFGATPEIIVFAYSYCAKLKKKNIKYVAAVVKEWVLQGLTDVEAVERHLEETDQRHYQYKRVLKALGFSRNATEEERRLMDSWFDEMDCSLEKVLEACNKTSGISNPNMNYVNKVLKNWKEDGGSDSGGAGSGSSGPVAVSTVMKYYDYIRQEEQDSAAKRRREVYKKIPEIKDIEKQLNDLSMEISKLIIFSGGDRSDKIKELKDKSNKLLQEKAILLTENDFEINYMEIKYMCDLCKDSGTNEAGDRCRCFTERAKEAEVWQRTNETKDN